MQGKLKFMYEAEVFLADFQFQLWCLAKDKIDMIRVEDHICVGGAGFNKPIWPNPLGHLMCFQLLKNLMFPDAIARISSQHAS